MLVGNVQMVMMVDKRYIGAGRNLSDCGSRLWIPTPAARIVNTLASMIPNQSTDFSNSELLDLDACSGPLSTLIGKVTN